MGFLDSLKAIGEAVNPFSSIVNTVGSAITSGINRHSQKETNKANAQQNELSREFTAQQAQLDRDFNAQQSNLQNAFNAAEAAKSRVFNADQARQQMEFQEKMWNAQNEYNDPSAQIARLKAAGINPNWSDGFDNTAGSVSGGAAATSSPASGSPASHGSLGAPGNIPMQPVTLENPLMMASQIRLANAQAEKAENDADRTKQLTPFEVETEKANASFIGAQTALSEKQKEVASANIDKIYSDIMMNNDQMKSNEVVRALNSANKEEKDRANKLFDDTYEEAIKQFELQTGLMVANKYEILTRGKSNLAQSGYYGSAAALADAQAGYYGSAAALADAQAGSYAFGNFWDNQKIKFYKKNKGYVSVLISKEADSNKWKFTFDSSEAQRGYWQNYPFLGPNDPKDTPHQILRTTDSFFGLMGHNFSLLKFGK